MRIFFLSFFAFLFTLVHSQLTQTVTDAAGDSIIEVVTQNRQGVPTTSTVSTILADAAGAAGAATSVTTALTTALTTATTAAVATTATTATTAATLAQGGGVVGAPAPTTNANPTGPTPFTYTTVIGGVTTIVPAVFTPTFATVAPTHSTISGSILDYSQWLSEFGSSTSSAAASSASRVSLGSPGLLGTVMVSVFGMGFGAMIVFS